MRITHWIFGIVLGTTLVFTSCGGEKPRQLNIAAAANMQHTLEALCAAFEDEEDIHCERISASSGVLFNQIMAGAPYDIYLSANMEYPQKLAEQNRGIELPQVFAFGKLILWSRNQKCPTDLNALSDSCFHHIAIPNPLFAPYGLAALQALGKKQVYAEVMPKIVYGENISQNNQFIVSGAADIGFTSKSSVLTPQSSDLGFWNEVDPSLYSPIEHGVIIVNNKDEKKIEDARKFLHFLKGQKAHDILVQHGYSLPPNE